MITVCYVLKTLGFTLTESNKKKEKYEKKKFKLLITFLNRDFISLKTYTNGYL